MMSDFLRNIRNRIDAMMRDRNGVDQLGWAVLILAAALYLIGTVIRSRILLCAGMVLYGYCVFRLLSKNRGQRNLENRRYVNATRKVKTKVDQFFLQLKDLRTYKYFFCPQCHTLMRMKRDTGEKKICCPKCKHEFSIKA